MSKETPVKSIAEQAQEDVVANLTPKTVTLVEQNTFGESGDVFDHRFWRNIFLVLWSLIPLRKSLFSLASLHLLRGKSTKVNNKASVVSYELDLSKITAQEKAHHKAIIGDGLNFKIKVNYATEQSKVSSKSLTPERLKCMLRMILTPTLADERRFPATSESIGYADMAKSFLNYQIAITKAVGIRSPSDMAEVKLWTDNVGLLIAKEEFTKSFQYLSIVAGCFSSKEIYLEDDQLYPGCIWWSGIHAMMTDAANKLRAPNAREDVRARMENSDFYGDFKRKMAARSISVASSPSYYQFLSAMKNIMVAFLRVGSMLTREESAVLDSILKDHINASKETRPVLEDVPVIKDLPEFSVGPSDNYAEKFSSHIHQFLNPVEPDTVDT